MLNAPLAEVDPELFDIIEKEKNRQCKVTLLHAIFINLHVASILHVECVFSRIRMQQGLAVNTTYSIT